MLRLCTQYMVFLEFLWITLHSITTIQTSTETGLSRAPESIHLPLMLHLSSMNVQMRSSLNSCLRNILSPGPSVERVSAPTRKSGHIWPDILIAATSRKYVKKEITEMLSFDTFCCNYYYILIIYIKIFH